MAELSTSHNQEALPRLRLTPLSGPGETVGQIQRKAEKSLMRKHVEALLGIWLNKHHGVIWYLCKDKTQP